MASEITVIDRGFGRPSPPKIEDAEWYIAASSNAMAFERHSGDWGMKLYKPSLAAAEWYADVQYTGLLYITKLSM